MVIELWSIFPYRKYNYNQMCTDLRIPLRLNNKYLSNVRTHVFSREFCADTAEKDLKMKSERDLLNWTAISNSNSFVRLFLFLRFEIQLTRLVIACAYLHIRNFHSVPRLLVLLLFPSLLPVGLCSFLFLSYSLSFFQHFMKGKQLCGLRMRLTSSFSFEIHKLVCYLPFGWILILSIQQLPFRLMYALFWSYF